MEQYPHEVPPDCAVVREGLGKVDLPRCISQSEGPFGTYSCAVFSDYCMSSSFVPGTVLGAGSVLAKMGFSDLRKLRNLLLC